ncbi:LacI family DNA-binding transcriptional regulator [Paenibacillus harenae]|uniref:LacI family DNA-binding transcriptional regulator n=1 Tax=Paenibacillus harenae TaxID=306543 RepID=UPI00278D4F1E|nr:LacI family DNA-binding transcriptional regulator [Paenibacillus harenae]MDQ0060335.1 LacI family transcriptional regulator [Paenibacillus harenae]
MSIKEVAKRANVSTATVSHVINGTRYVANETKMRVLEVMKELKYQPNSVARSLRSKQSKIIGLMVPILPNDTASFFFMSIAQGIESVLTEKGYSLILSNTKDDSAMEQAQVKMFNSQLIDGLIMAPTYEEHAYLDTLRTGDYPVVFIDRKPTEAQGDCVLTEGARGAYEAVAHLIGKGHERIGFITGSLGLTTSDERLAGYKQALADNGVPIEEQLIQVADSTNSSFDSGYRLTQKLITNHHITALFVANNVMTMGALHYLQENNIAVPDDIAIIGFDDYEWARVTRPALSMVKQPSFELGEAAANILLERIENPDAEYKEVRLPTELIIRGSS